MRLYVWTIACALTACDVEQDAMFLPDAQIEDAESDDSRDRGMNPRPPRIESDTRVNETDQRFSHDASRDAGRLTDVRIGDSAYADAAQSPRPDAALIDSAVLTNITYQPIVGTISNPERGLYVHVEQRLHGTQSTSIQQSVFDRVYATGKRLVLLVIDLGAHRNEAISAEELEVLNQDFNRLKASGLKAILRFRYTASATLPYGDVAPVQVTSHLSQLTDLCARMPI